MTISISTKESENGTPTIHHHLLSHRESCLKTTVTIIIMSDQTMNNTDLISFESITDNDVLSGRGGATNHHTGNVRFRELVKQHQGAYIRAQRREKPNIASQIVAEVRKRGGRFLKQQLPEKLWVDVGDKKAREKTSQALREGAPDARLILDTFNCLAKSGETVAPQVPAATNVSDSSTSNRNVTMFVPNPGGLPHLVKAVSMDSTISLSSEQDKNSECKYDEDTLISIPKVISTECSADVPSSGSDNGKKRRFSSSANGPPRKLIMNRVKDC